MNILGASLIGIVIGWFSDGPLQLILGLFIGCIGIVLIQWDKIK